MKIKALIILLLISVSSAAQNDSILKTYSKTQLLADYDLAVSSLKEAHPGLYWYTNFFDYEKIFTANRNKIKSGMTSYEFYKILSNITSADKEGHSSVSSSKDIREYIRAKAKYLPFAVKTVNNKIYLLNDIGNIKSKGKIITEINNSPIDTVLSEIFKHTSRYSDGFSTTGKYKLIDRFSFSGYYFDFISNPTCDKVSIKLLSPENNRKETHLIELVSRDSLVNIAKQTPRKERKHDNKLYNHETINNIDILTFNDLNFHRYKKTGLPFSKLIDSLFKEIKSKNLILDIRNLSGGSEGAEDYLFSYLTSKPYKKYKYVQANGFSFSFIEHTDYKDNPENLEKMLINEHELKSDGRFLRKDTVLQTVAPQEISFNGQLYILISGKTYSGGSELASIAKTQSKAIFIGEETGGGFYGQTSGIYVYLLLPNTQLEVRIPLLKFSTTFESADIPHGRGVIPDYEIEQSFNDFINGIDTEMEFTLKLIEKKE